MIPVTWVRMRGKECLRVGRLIMGLSSTVCVSSTLVRTSTGYCQEPEPLLNVPVPIRRHAQERGGERL